MKFNPKQSNNFLIFLGFVAAISLVVGAPLALASLNFAGNNIVGDTGGVIIDSSSTIAIGTSTASAVMIGNPSSTISLSAATTTISNLTITGTCTGCTTGGSSSSVSGGANDVLFFTASSTATTSPNLTYDGANLHLASGTIYTKGAPTSSIASTLNIGTWGDSLTYGDEDASGYSYPNQMAQYLPGANVRNFGISGQTSAQIETRFLASTSTLGWFSVIWAGQNDFGAPTSVVQNIAAMVASSTGNYIVMSVKNGEATPSGTTQFAEIAQINSTLSSTYGPTGHYLDIDDILRNDYNPAIPADVLDYNNYVYGPYSLRASDLTGTLAGSITATTTSFTITPGPGNTIIPGYILNIGSELIYVSSSTGNTVISSTRGYAGTTAVSYSTSTSLTGIDPVHLSAQGYNVVAQNVVNAIESLMASSSVITNNNVGAAISSFPYVTNNGYSEGFGSLSLYNNTATHDTGVGYDSLSNNTTGDFNNAFGFRALYNNTTGTQNSAFGHEALDSNTIGSYNTAFGAQALLDEVTSSQDTAFGAQTLSNTTASQDSAFGFQALANDTSGTSNAAFGYNTLTANTTGNYNTAYGTSALSNVVSSNGDTTIGYNSMYANTDAHDTAIGYYAGRNSTTGQNDTYLGYQAGTSNSTGGNNTSSASSTFVGANTEPLNSGDSNEIVIGQAAVGQGSNTTVIGNSSTVATFLGGNSLRLGTTTKAFCMEGYDSVSTTTLEYIYTINGALTATSTKPSFCQ